MSDKKRKAEEALARFQARNAADQEEAAPEAVDLETAEEIAEELDIQPDTMEIPPGIVRGVFIYELEDGTFGYKNLAGGRLDIMDAISLGSRLVEGARTDMTALKTVQLLKSQPQSQAPVRVARPLGRRSQ
jgi:hypothetical protein